MLNSSATFFIKGGDTGFADRERRLLECLAAAESEKNGRRDSSLNGGDPAVAGASRPSRKRRRAETKPFRGKESIFKEPGDPPPRWGARARDDVPDHHRNPHRWVRYSLGDVSPEDMSDQSNTATALAFLRELELRKELPAGGDMDCDPPGGAAPVAFKRPAQRGGPGRAEPADTAVFKSSKLVMPEYVVGRDKKERKSRGAQPGSKYDKSKEIKLQHLQFEDDPE